MTLPAKGRPFSSASPGSPPSGTGVTWLNGRTAAGEAAAGRDAADRDLGFSSTNGGITVRLPRDARLSVDAATTNGGIDSDFELAGGAARRSRLTGDINGGGSTLRIRTTNGSVHIKEI